MSPQILSGIPVAPVPSTLLPDNFVNHGSLQGRTVTLAAMTKEQNTIWAKICLWVHQFIHWIKNLTSPHIPPMEVVVERLPPLDTSYLKPQDAEYNLRRLSAMGASNAVQSVSTEDIFKAVPLTNPIRLGYEDAAQYRTVLGDRAIAAHIGLTALGILGTSLGSIFKCAATNTYSFKSCVKSEGTSWQHPSGQTILLGSALLLGASLYAHAKGWLGAILHDPFISRRHRQLKTLFKNAADELLKEAQSKPEIAQQTAKNILKNQELIVATLNVELQLSKNNAREISNILKEACEQVLEGQFYPMEQQWAF